MSTYRLSIVVLSHYCHNHKTVGNPGRRLRSTSTTRLTTCVRTGSWQNSDELGRVVDSWFCRPDYKMTDRPIKPFDIFKDQEFLFFESVLRNITKDWNKIHVSLLVAFPFIHWCSGRILRNIPWRSNSISDLRWLSRLQLGYLHDKPVERQTKFVRISDNNNQKKKRRQQTKNTTKPPNYQYLYYHEICHRLWCHRCNR